MFVKSFSIKAICLIILLNQILSYQNVYSLFIQKFSLQEKVSSLESELITPNTLSEPKEYFSFIQTETESISSASYPALLQAIGQNSNNKVIVLLASETASNSTTNSNSKSKSKEMNNDDFNYSVRYQIFIWFPIGCSLILLFTVWMLIDMPIQKSSILYANYISKKVNSG